MNRTHQRIILLLVTALALAVVSGCDEGDINSWAPAEDHESVLDANWMAAGQPSEARLRALVGLGARIISIRLADEDPYPEQAIVEELGGTFLRFEVESSRYTDPAFRASLYDFIDAQRAIPGRVYFHCRSSNRIGAAWALYNYERLGLGNQAAYDKGVAAGLSSLDPTVRMILGL